MNISISRSPRGSTKTNTGSVRDLVYYLEKENKNKATHEKRWFFSHRDDMVSPEEVIHAIDNNKKGLKNSDAKYYLLNISPSQKELTHIDGDEEKLKAFTRSVMDEYAKNFDRNYETTGDDLMYFAKIEEKRKYKGYDQAVKDGTAKQGDEKPGLQTHIHVIVARKSKDGTRQFSPHIKHRAMTQDGPIQSGFHRGRFVEKTEKIFDDTTGYQRSLTETFRYRNTMKNGSLEEKAAMHTLLQQEKGLTQKPNLGQGIKSIGKSLGSGQEFEHDNSIKPKI